MCYKRGGVSCPCYAVTGDHRYYHGVIDTHRCQSVTPSDLSTVLSSLDASVEIAGAGGIRRLDVSDFYSGPGEVRLEAGAYVRSVILDPSRYSGHDYRKLNRGHGDFAVISTAVSVAMSPDGTVTQARVFLGAMAPVPYRVHDAERLIIDRMPEMIDSKAAATSWFGRAHPLTRNEWKVDAAAELLHRSITAALDRAQLGGRT